MRRKTPLEPLGLYSSSGFRERLFPVKYSLPADAVAAFWQSSHLSQQTLLKHTPEEGEDYGDQSRSN